MNYSLLQLFSVPWALLAVLLVSSNTQAQAERPPWAGLPKELKWQGKVGGEQVVVTIKAGEFVEAEHKVLKNADYVVEVDGYRAEFGNPRNGLMPPHITSWEILWGDKQVSLPRGVYSSVFLPYLKGPAKEFSATSRTSDLWIGPSEDGKALLVIMMSGFDAQHERLAFVISKDGEVRRFSFGISS